MPSAPQHPHSLLTSCAATELRVGHLSAPSLLAHADLRLALFREGRELVPRHSLFVALLTAAINALSVGAAPGRTEATGLPLIPVGCVSLATGSQLWLERGNCTVLEQGSSSSFPASHPADPPGEEGLQPSASLAFGFPQYTLRPSSDTCSLQSCPVSASAFSGL